MAIQLIPKSLSHDVVDKDLLASPGLRDLEFIIENQFICSCCGFKSRPHQQFPSGGMEVVEVEGDKQCLCSFCSSSQHLNRTINGDAYHGKIIAIKGIDQAQCSHLVRTCAGVYFDEKFSNEQRSKAKNLLTFLSDKTVLVDGSLHEAFEGCRGDTEVLSDISLAWINTSEESYDEAFCKVAYKPDELVFRRLIEFWRKANPGYFMLES